MKKIAMIYSVLIAALGASNAYGQDSLSFLHGDWAGTGTTSGLAASIRYAWKPVLSDQFTVLRLHNRMTGEDGRDIVFEGIGYYQTSDEQSFTGVWVDSQGQILPLQASLKEQTLTAIWGTKETKLGRSVYRLLSSGKLEAVNSIADETGEWREFGRAVLSRTELAK